jgi:hypothetical protein
MSGWSIEQIEALAPDEASVKAGRGLASPKKWVSLNTSPRAIWGECQGSGKQPYRTEIDLQGANPPALKCDCPSRKFPCKHGLGLFLLFAKQSTLFNAAEPPAWVEEWLKKRDSAEQKKTAKTAEENSESASDPAKAAEREAARAKRSANREQRVRDGLEELARWLQDVIRQGLPAAQQQPRRFLEMAGRMVDAQAPGVGRLLRECPTLAASGEAWAERLLHQLGLIHLLIESHSRLETLPEPVQADVRAAIGWTVQENELNTPPIQDRWMVAGQRVTEEDALRVQRTWLIGGTSQRFALILHFAAAGQPLDITLAPGTTFEGELVFFPSNSPIRAAIRSRGETRPATSFPALATFDEALSSYAGALAGNPFLERFPIAVNGCRLVGSLDAPLLIDSGRKRIPIAQGFRHTPELFALGGGHPLAVCGEWNGVDFFPLSTTTADGRFIAFNGLS